MDNVLESYLNKAIEKNSYLDKYGGSLIFTIVFLLAAFVVLSYFYVKNKFESIKQNWTDKRCQPEILPFAGLINAPDGTSKTQYTAKNFTMCLSTISNNVIKIITKPLHMVVNIFMDTFSLIIKSIGLFANFFNDLRSGWLKYFRDILFQVLNVMLPMQKIFIKIKDILAKTSGILALTIYQILSIYRSMKSFLGAFLQVVIGMLIALAAAIIIMWFFPWTWIPATAASIFFAVIAVPFILINIVLGRALSITSNKDMPDCPDGGDCCFDKNTKIKVKNEYKKFSNLKVNDILSDGAKVTAFFKMSSKNVDMYKINNLIVSGTHKIYHKQKKWIFVKDHPKAILINNYSEPYIYCINTTSKKIYIDNHILSDWDDIDEIDFINLKKLTEEFLLPWAKTSEIHSKLESGFHENTLIELEDGMCVKIKDVQVNDILRFGDKVIGIVEIDGENISNIYKYNIDNKTFIGGPNLWINDDDLGKFSTLALDSKKIINKNNKLYQIITDTGFFQINGVRFMDYNSAIEQIMGVSWCREQDLSLF
jgi:hypothetical protein